MPVSQATKERTALRVVKACNPPLDPFAILDIRVAATVPNETLRRQKRKLLYIFHPDRKTLAHGIGDGVCPLIIRACRCPSVQLQKPRMRFNTLQETEARCWKRQES